MISFWHANYRTIGQRDLHMKSGLVLFTLLLLASSTYAKDQAPLANALLSFYTANSDSARVIIESYAEAHPESDSAWYYLGRVQFEDGEYKDAAKSFEQATELTEGSSLFHLWLARTWGQRAMEANLLSKGRYANKFKDQVDLAIEFDPDNLDAREDRLQFFLQAPGIMGGGTDKAYAEAESIAVRDLQRGVNARVNVLVADGKPELAEQEIRRAIATVPEDSMAIMHLVYFQQGRGWWDRAFATLDSLLAERPGFRPALYQLGRTAGFAGQRHDDGIAALQRYIELGDPPEDQPQLTYAWFRLGKIHEADGEREAAIQAYRTAVELDSTNQWAREALNGLASP